MKTLTVEKNRVFIHHEMSDKTCEEILKKSQSSLRFDLTYKDDDENLKTWRGTIKKGDAELPILEIRDYEDNKRQVYTLSPHDTVLDASTIAMRQVWNWIEAHSDRFPPTSALPIINDAE